MKKIIAGFIALVATMAVTAFAQTTPSVNSATPPIKSQDVLREYSLGKGVRGFRDVQSASLVTIQGQPTYVEVRGTSAEDVLKKLFSTDLVYKLANESDKVKGNVWIYDESDNLIFYGYSEYFILALQKGPGPEYKIWMYNVPILNDVISAEILVLGEDGATTRTEPVTLKNDQVLFGPWYAGVPNGILSVKFKGGAMATYNLWNPTANSPSTLSESATWKIDGHYVIDDSGKGDYLLVNIIETWTLPTATITVYEGRNIRFDVLGLVNNNGVSTFERPTAVIFTQIEGGTWSGAGPIFPDSPTELTLPAAGKYRVHFEWTNFGKPGMLYTGPTDGKG